ARTLVAIGLQDRGGRNIIAARQRVQRVAGADDDGSGGGGAVRRSMGGGDRARRDRAGGLKRRAGWWSIGGEPTPSSGYTGTGREQSNSTTRDMVTHCYATNYCFE